MDAFAETMPGNTDDAPLVEMIQAVARGANRDLEHSETLPPGAYVSQSFFDLEVQKVLRPGWICVGHVSQVPAVGDYFALDLLKEMLVVVRGKDEVVRTLSRICTHRWAPLVQGCGNAKLFSCPFHKWGFDLQGNLLGAPLMEQVAFDLGRNNLPNFKTEVVDGFIYVNLTGDAPSITEALSSYSEKLKKFKLHELVVAGEFAYECKFNWKILVETFMECYHHIAAHPETFEAAFPARLSFVEDGTPAWTVGTAPARDTIPAEEIQIGLPLLADNLTREEMRSFFLYLVYPSHLIAVWADRIYWFRAQPVGPDKTILQTYILVRPEAKAMPNYDEIIGQDLAFLDKVNLEDIMVNEMQQLGARTASAQVGRFSHLEKAVWQLSDYIRSKVAV